MLIFILYLDTNQIIANKTISPITNSIFSFFVDFLMVKFTFIVIYGMMILTPKGRGELLPDFDVPLND